MLTLLTLPTPLLSTVVNKATMFTLTNNMSTRQQLPFLSCDCSIISYNGRPDTDDHPNNHYHVEHTDIYSPMTLWRETKFYLFRQSFG